MKKKYYLLIAFIGMICQAQVNIPDPDFKGFLTDPGHIPLIDANADGEIQQSEALAVTDLAIVSINIQDYTGIEAFINLETLTLPTYGNSDASVDLSALVNLKSLNCESSRFFSLSLPQNSILEYLDMTSSRIENFNLNSLINLKTLKCGSIVWDQVPGGLNISALVNLETLVTENGDIGTFDATNHPNLKYLNCNQNNMMTLDVTGLSQLETLLCGFNSIQELNVSGLSALKKLNCADNRLTSLAIDNLTTLEELSCGGNSLSVLNVGNLTNLRDFSCSYGEITSLNLLPLVNLTNLNVSANPLGTLDLSTLINLTSLGCRATQLTTLNINHLINLTSIDISMNPLGTIDITNLVNLKSLYCYDNELTALDVSHSTALETIYCINNALTSLDITNLTNLRELSCYHNQLTALDMSNNHKLTRAYCESNRFTTLDFSHANDPDTFSFECSINDNPLLTYVNLKNGKLGNFVGGDFENLNCPNLRYICADEDKIQYIMSDLQIGQATNVQVNSYCSFTPSGNYNTISGTVRIDLNGNGCDSADSTFPMVKLNINDGSQTGATFTNPNGTYAFFTQEGSYDITPQLENPFFTISPTAATIDFSTIDETTFNQNFCITPVGIHNDVEVSILSVIPARPGFDAAYNIIYKNKGNQTLSGNVSLNFNDTVLDLISAVPSATAQIPGNLSWNYTNLKPFESRLISIVVNVNSPMETPAVNIDDILNFTATVFPVSNDASPSDNVYAFNENVTGSFDPNDKTCLEGATFSPEKVGDYLHYLVRFQNSGNAPAVNVVVKDVLNESKFDVSSFQLTSASHPHVTRIDKNKVEFIFENINLPAEQDDEPGSHGYIAFKIKTKNTLVLGDAVTNVADIYFDFNFPIITNEATSTVAVLGVNQHENKSVKIYPNPVKNTLNISAKENITSIQVFDVQGRLLQTQLTNNTSAIVDLSQKSNGFYLAKIRTENGVKTEKILKE